MRPADSIESPIADRLGNMQAFSIAALTLLLDAIERG